MKFGSVCSGMEAASLAWLPLGWTCAFTSEIDKAPSALLAQRYPDVPNFGDMTKFEEWPDVAIDLLAGGTPCQSFSVAGLRKGIADPRGSLMLTYGAIAKRYRPTWLFWENVPGVLSSNGGRDFGAFLGMLAELGYGFAYRVLDAQFFGLAQRRKRVFVVGYLGDWRPPAAVLFERESLRGDSAPSREAGQRPAPTISARTKGGGGLGTDAELDGALIATQSAGLHLPRMQGGEQRGVVADVRMVQSYELYGHAQYREGVAPLRAQGGDCHGGSETLIAQQVLARCVTAREGLSNDYEVNTLIAHALRGDGFDASEDGRGTPLVPVAIQAGATRENPDSGPDGVGVQEHIAYTLEARAEVQSVCQPYTLAIRGRGDSHELEYRQDGIANAVLTPNGGRGGIGVGAIAFDTTQITSPECRSNPKSGDPCHTLAKGQHAPAIAFSCKDHGADAGELAPTLRAMGHDGSHANAGGQAAVRRLTPKECERLQGAPDDWTNIAYRGRNTIADGPRYKMIGNSWAVPVIRWIGERIDLVSAEKERAA